VTAKLAIIIAVAENGIIGRGGQLPWRLPSDLRRFRALTLAKPVIMGRKTYAGIGKPLAGRDNIVLTRDPAFAAPGVDIATTLDDAIAQADRLVDGRNGDEIMIIGGGEIYPAALRRADRIYLTLVHACPAGDTSFAPLDPAVWSETARAPMQQMANDQYPADFIILDRKRPSPTGT
jgi:dihydrofolate reductase